MYILTYLGYSYPLSLYGSTSTAAALIGNLSSLKNRFIVAYLLSFICISWSICVKFIAT